MFGEALKRVSERMAVPAQEIPKEVIAGVGAMGMTLDALKFAMNRSICGARDAVFQVQPFRPAAEPFIMGYADAACEILRLDGIGCRALARQAKETEAAADPEAWEIVIEMTW